MFTPFQSEYPYANFAEDRPKRKMEEALAAISSQSSRVCPLVIGGRRIETVERKEIRNPARFSQALGLVCQAPVEMVDAAVRAASDAFPAWSRLTAAERARYFTAAAAILRRRIYEFSAAMVLESSKSWLEAYADAAEAIDFLEFYAREAVRWQQPGATTPFPGEENEVLQIPLGVGAVIAPWNFPLAILAGMTVAAAVTGNTVIMKPAEQTSIIASRFMELLELTGLPPGVVNYLPGPGEVVGAALVEHPGIRFVSFTGSRDVGVQIHAKAAIVQPGQKWLKRTVLEMGGKDAIVVDEGVNLDAVAAEVVASAFGFQGQKCSACSRLIAHTAVYDDLLPKVVERTRKLVVGDPSQQGVNMGAVIDRDAYIKILNYVSIGQQEGRILMGGADRELPDQTGWFVHPAIFADVQPDARIAREEIFGPVLSCIRAENWDHAIEIANSTDYGLTGAAFSYNRAHLEQARRDFHVGNLYLNRKCTGALVDVQPFGGFNMSGTNSKAGGRDYLGHFLQAKSISERW
jgi:1-pyrroline-5-carboxylate dehydrogenase